MRSPVLSSRQFEWTLAAFIATLAGHLLWLPPWYAAMLGGVLVARWLQRRAYARAWPGWIKFPLLLAVLVMAVPRFGDPSGRHAAAAALLGLSVLKLIESERRRDALWILPVALFLVSIQFLFTQGIGITLYMVIPTLLIFLALNEVCAPPGTRGGMTTQLGSLGREFLLMLAVVLPLTVFLFLSVPRLSEPLWGARENFAQEGRTGLGNEMSPGTISQLIGDDTPVMRVTFQDRAPGKRSMYWRGPVLWTYNGTTWLAIGNLAAPGQTEGRLDGPQTGAADDLHYRVVLEPTDRNQLYLLDLATGFPVASRRTVEGGVVRNRDITELYAFDASAELDAPIPVWAFPKFQRNAGLQLPSGRNPRSFALAQTWREEVGDDPMALAQRALRHIHTENFGYTLSPPPLVGADRMDEFLFETRLGFCEHYASAFVVLMRSAGVPARVVTGYLGGEYNRIGGYWLVRNSDAHAWAEILVPERGWVRVDPTAAIAPERVDQSGGAFSAETLGDSEFLRAIRERVDALQAWWNNTIVRFNSQRQEAFFASLGINPGDWRHAAAWMGAGLALFGGLTALIFVLQRPRSSSDRAKLEYQRFLQALKKLGVVARPNEGPMDFGRRASLALPAFAKPIFGVISAYEQARYGVPTADALTQLQAALAEFRAALRA